MMGKKLCGAWLMKYAKAISPDMINADARENRPISRSPPPTNSIAPENQDNENRAGGGIGCGKPNILDRPCSKKRRATTILTILRT